MTLEPRYRRSKPCLGELGEDSDACAADFSPKTVPAMMRSASGCWTEELAGQLHQKMLQDGVAVLSRSKSSSYVLK